MMNAKLKTVLYVLYSIPGGLIMFGLMVLMALNEWGYYAISGGFVLLVIWKLCQALYTIIKTQSYNE